MGKIGTQLISKKLIPEIYTLWLKIPTAGIGMLESDRTWLVSFLQWWWTSTLCFGSKCSTLWASSLLTARGKRSQQEEMNFSRFTWCLQWHSLAYKSSHGSSRRAVLALTLNTLWTCSRLSQQWQQNTSGGATQSKESWKCPVRVRLSELEETAASRKEDPKIASANLENVSVLRYYD